MIEDVLVAVADWKQRSPGYRLFRDYYDGRHRQAFSSEAFDKLFRDILEQSRENLCPAAVKVFTNRLKITGWEGAGATSAQEAFDAIGGPRIANMVHREAHRSGDGFVLVWPGKDGRPRPWVHRAEQVSVMVDPQDPDEFAWVAKVWLRPDGYGRVNVYYPATCERWVTARKVRQPSQQREDNSLRADSEDTWPTKADGWEPYETGEDGGPVLEHDFGVSPWAWLPHDADTLGDYGRSVLHDVIPIQDALNKSVADVIVNSEAYALPLRAILNYEAKTRIDPETGKASTEQLKYDLRKSRLLGIPGAGPLTQLDAPDATKLMQLHDAFALKIARIIGAPAYEFTQGTGDVPSGVSLRVLADRRTSAIEDFQQDASPGWTRLMSLMGVPDVRPTWEDPAPMDDTERLEGAASKRDLGFPFATVARELGYDDDDLVEIEKDRVREDAASNAAAQAAARAYDQGRPTSEVLE